MANKADERKSPNLFKATILDVPWMPTAKVILLWIAILVGAIAARSFFVK